MKGSLHLYNVHCWGLRCFKGVEGFKTTQVLIIAHIILVNAVPHQYSKWPLTRPLLNETNAYWRQGSGVCHKIWNMGSCWVIVVLGAGQGWGLRVCLKKKKKIRQPFSKLYLRSTNQQKFLSVRLGNWHPRSPPWMIAHLLLLFAISAYPSALVAATNSPVILVPGTAFNLPFLSHHLKYTVIPPLQSIFYERALFCC
jgi:hypothetical protein